MANGDASNCTNGNGNKPVVLSSRTLMPLGLVVAVVLAFWRGTTVLNERFDQLAAADRTVVEQLTLIRLSLNNRWTASDQKIWSQALKIGNPTMSVPDIDVVYTGQGRSGGVN